MAASRKGCHCRQPAFIIPARCCVRCIAVQIPGMALQLAGPAPALPAGKHVPACSRQPTCPSHQKASPCRCHSWHPHLPACLPAHLSAGDGSHQLGMPGLWASAVHQFRISFPRWVSRGGRVPAGLPELVEAGRVGACPPDAAGKLLWQQANACLCNDQICAICLIPVQSTRHLCRRTTPPAATSSPLQPLQRPQTTGTRPLPGACYLPAGCLLPAACLPPETLLPAHACPARERLLRASQPRPQLKPRLVCTPTAASACRVFLVFDGVDSAFYCWLNGQVRSLPPVIRLPAAAPACYSWYSTQAAMPLATSPPAQPTLFLYCSLQIIPPPSFLQFVGYSQDSRLPAEFDVGPLLRPGGDNVLSVQVRGGSAVAMPDCWRRRLLSNVQAARQRKWRTAGMVALSDACHHACCACWPLPCRC